MKQTQHFSHKDLLKMISYLLEQIIRGVLILEVMEF